MKFTKEQANQALVGAMTKKGEKLHLSSRSINEQLDALMPLLANEETELADFVEKVLPLFNTANANVRNDVSQEIKEYKEKNPLPPTPPTPPTPPKEGESELEKRLKALEEELENSRKEKKVNNVKQELIAKMSELGVKDNEWVSSFLQFTNIAEDIDVESKAKEYVEFYNKSKAEYNPDLTPGITGGGKGVEDKIQEAIKRAGEVAKSRQLISQDK